MNRVVTGEDSFRSTPAPSLRMNGRVVRCIKSRFLIVFLVLWQSSLAGSRSAAQTAATDVFQTYASEHAVEIMGQLRNLVALPNVSSNQADVRLNAEYLVNEFKKRGAELELLEVPGANPVIYGEIKTPEAKRTVMIYAHFDGQPVKSALWTSTQPFEPTLYSKAMDEGGRKIDWPKPGQDVNDDWRIYGRSTSDDKAPFVAIMAALDAIEESELKPTSNIKFFFDGEEEIGSPNMRRVLERYADRFEDVDLWVFSDGPLHQSRKPAVYFGVRGVTGMEITVYGATRNLHSGHYGNWAPNPGLLLSQLLASMKDDDGNVLVEGFSDDVVPLQEKEIAALKAIPAIDDDLRNELGLAETENKNQAYIERMQLPSLNIRGIECGSVGTTARNIVPNTATVSIDIRLVKGNQPRKMLGLVRNHIQQQGYHIVESDPSLQVRRKHGKIAKVVFRENGYPAARTSMTHPQVLPLVRQLQLVAGDEQLLLVPSLGGSLPLYLISDYLQKPLVIVPMANHDNNQHAPDENIRVGNLLYGVQAMGAVLTMGQ